MYLFFEILFLHQNIDYVKVWRDFAVYNFCKKEEKIMARILESINTKKRTVKLSTDDIISIVQEYQQLTKGLRYLEDVRDILSDKVIFIPESE